MLHTIACPIAHADLLHTIERHIAHAGLHAATPLRYKHAEPEGDPLRPQEYQAEENGRAQPRAKRRYQVGRVTLRTLFFDRHLLAALRGGAAQVVLLGAGMDSRAWRLDLPPGADKSCFSLPVPLIPRTAFSFQPCALCYHCCWVPMVRRMRSALLGSGVWAAAGSRLL